MTKWQKALTKAQRAHLSAHGITSLKKLAENYQHQDKWLADTGLPACHTCTSIWLRLYDAGIELPEV